MKASLGFVMLALAACSSPAPAAPTTAAAPTAAPKPVASPATSASPSASTSPAPSASAAVVPSPSASAIASPSPAAAAAPQPPNASLSIASPTAGQTVPAGTVMVSVTYNGPALVAAASATKLDDYHLHYFLDENAAPYVGTLVPVPMGNPHIVHSAALQVSFDNVTAGSHTVTVALSGANHITVMPPLTAQVTFTAQ